MKKLITGTMFWSVAGAIAVAQIGAAFAADTAEDGQKVVCKRDSTVGTRLAKRICMTRAEWKEAESALRERNKDIQREYQEAGESRTPNGGDAARTVGPN